MLTVRDCIGFGGIVFLGVFLIDFLAKKSDWTQIFLPLNVLLVGSVVLGWVCLFSVPVVSELLLSAGLSGVDCHRVGAFSIPEATGVVVGFCYVVGLTLFVPVVGVGENLVMFLGAILSVNSMCFLGFVDNVLNLRWRHKLILPTIASLPVLFVYYSKGGSTYVLLPDIVLDFFQIHPKMAINFGVFYYVFLSMLSVFGTNSINIFAGINGLEIGQSIVLCSGMITNVLIQMNRHKWNEWQSSSNETIFSLYLMVPFLTCSIALWIYNKYPSRVFVGDTYCYLAGTVLAVAGILGHCSKTLLLFMVPQIINFVYSVPQLVRLVPCPRHRMPVYIAKTDQVDISFTEWTLKPKFFNILSLITKVERRNDGKVRFMNMTLINYTLWKLGKPVNEGKLVNVILFWQVVWIGVAFGLRYKAASLLYTYVD